MKDVKEIQRAHDILHPVAERFALDGQTLIPMNRTDARALHSAHDVLAWILEYRCGEAFDDNLERIYAELQKVGQFDEA